MARKLLAILLAATMVFIMLPISVMAADDVASVTVDGTETMYDSF